MIVQIRFNTSVKFDFTTTVSKIELSFSVKYFWAYGASKLYLIFGCINNESLTIEVKNNLNLSVRTV